MTPARPSGGLSAWRLNLLARAPAFSTYFCMYAFPKPFGAASYPGRGWPGLEWKTFFLTTQGIGYTLSKFLGIKWGSEVTRAQRLRMLIGLVLGSELALLGFAALPPAGKAVALFFNGLPLGMIWGLVVRYLEGRRASELLLA